MPSKRNKSHSSRVPTVPTSFHSWPELPVELKLEVLAYGIIDSSRNMKDFVSPIIATRNRELANLALEVYYKHNRFYLDSCVETDPGACMYHDTIAWRLHCSILTLHGDGCCNRTTMFSSKGWRRKLIRVPTITFDCPRALRQQTGRRLSPN
jgi:hypothetical protein